MKASDLRPSDPAIANTLGCINYKRGDYLLVLSLIQESVSKFSQNPEIQYHRGKTHAALNNDNEADAAKNTRPITAFLNRPPPSMLEEAADL